MAVELKSVWERQRELDLARERVRNVREEVRDHKAADWKRAWEETLDHPDVKAAQAEAEALAREVAGLHEEVGGSVFRVVDSKLDELAARIEKLNKKAVKLGTEPVVVTVSDEHDQYTFREDGHDRVVDYTFLTVNGETPMIAGWVFVATLDHEADEGADAGVGIRRAPVGAHLKDRIGEDAALAVENADLTEYRSAGPDCVHCGYKRRRNQTYVLYEVETGALRQVGTTCVADYTGAHNPERIAAWAEWLEALYSDLGSEDDGGFGGGGGRIAMKTVDYIAHVLAVVRESGWVSRWRKDGYGYSERNYDATADRAESNYFERNKKHRIEVTEADFEEARLALDWIREDVADRDFSKMSENDSEFFHNLVTYTRSDWVPKKGSGFVAYTPMARRREIEGEIKRERKAKEASESEWFGEVKKRIKGLEFTVSFTRSFESAYGVRTLVKGITPDGNHLTWWGNGDWLKQGDVVRAAFTVKAHETDDYNGAARTTVITNPRGWERLEDGEWVAA